MSVQKQRESDEFGGCQDGTCDGTAYYLVRDRSRGKEVRVCGDCLATLKGDKR